ncbi:MAG: HAD hydrolase family protein, partial [Acidobacteria bacterium]|nr:HAD hydrolase family protein [Acidobacteriota bacterium]
GRILDDLRRVTGGLHFVDAVVAENGAVVEFPASGYTTRNGTPPHPKFLEALGQVGITFGAGSVVVETDAADAHGILTIIRRLELPLAIAFNRGRLMVLPQTISKATGLRQALAILRLSPRNAVGIGDAENDHELLQVCEIGVAVAWGSEVLKAMADYVLPGDGPPAVADYVRNLATTRLLPAATRSRRRILLGHTDDGQPLELAVRGRNVLVAGDPKSGKSWVAGLLCEQLILQGYSLCILDPEGDYVSLEALPGVMVLGGANPLPPPGDVVRALRHADVSVVIDLSRARHDAKFEYMRNLLPALATLRRHTGLPHRIVVDEAHYFLHDADAPGLLDLQLNGYTLVSYRASKLHPDALAATQAIVVARESDPHEVQALFALCASCSRQRSPAEWHDMFGRLAIGEAAVLPVTEEAQGDLTRIRLAPRLTPHVRHQAKYIDVPVAESMAFVVWRNGTSTGRRIRTLREFVDVLGTTPASGLKGHLHRHDFSRWIADVFGDYPLAETIRAMEEDFRRGEHPDLIEGMAQAVRSRYEFVDPTIGQP